MNSPTENTEQQRQQELLAYGVLDTAPEPEFDRLTHLAARICEAPIAVITLVEDARQWFKSVVGLEVCETSKDISFCVHAIKNTEIMMVSDTLLDPRFVNNPLVTGDPHLRFYAGVPLISPNGYALGTLCVLDYVPRTLNTLQIEALKTLAEQVMVRFEIRRQSGNNTPALPPDYEIEGLLALSHSNRAYKMLLRCNEVMIKTNKEDALLQEICRIIVETGGYAMACVGYKEDDAFKSVFPQSRFGETFGKDEAFFQSFRLSWSEDQLLGLGAVGISIRNAEPVLFADVTQEADYKLLNLSEEYGYRGIVSLPLKHQEHVFGALILLSKDALHISKDELDLLSQMAANLAFGIINVRAQEQQHRTQMATAEVATMVSGTAGQNIFQNLAFAIAEAFNADAVLLTQFLAGNPPTMASCLAAVLDGKLVENSDHLLAGTPCIELLDQDLLVTPSAAKERYPHCALFVQLGINAYVGMRIRNTAYEPLGTLNILYRKPLLDAANIIPSLKIFAARAAAEIERQVAEAQIQHLAFYDSLTHLPNRQLLYDRLQQALIFCVRAKKMGAILLIDLDNFKTLNDTLGHDVGDLLLQQVATRLNLCVRESDTVARFGGDEFVLLLEEISEASEDTATHAGLVGEKILASFNEPFLLDQHEHRCTPSIGIALFGEHSDNVDEVLKNADLAMYQAKNAGRNTLRFFESKMQEAIAVRAAIEKGLHQALQKNEFVLHFQPQLDDDGKLQSAEVLVRWQHPENGQILPATFIALAEETGLISDIGQWVLQAACKQLAEWAEQPDFSKISLSVNVSPRQFHHPDFLAQVLATLQETGANPYRLRLELTEGLLVDNVEQAIEKMAALRAEGVSFSLDDFGTGYSSLAYLKRLPLSQLKIDQFFVKDVLTNSNNSAIIRTIIALGYSLGLQVMAEGVESKSQREYLKRMSCHAYQGYFLSHPLPADEFVAFVREMATSSS